MPRLKINDSGREWKVGLFFLISLVLLTILLVQFSKGSNWFVSSYDIFLKTQNVGGLKSKAQVLMAGVQIGTVIGADLESDGKTVRVELKILERYSISDDAIFSIEQAGFLGDQFVSILTGESSESFLETGAEVTAQEPFNLQNAARIAADLAGQFRSAELIAKVGDTVHSIRSVIDRVDRILVTESTLTNLSRMIENSVKISDRMLTTINRLDDLIQTNAPSVNRSLANFEQLSLDLNRLTGDIGQIVETNRNEIALSLRSLRSSSEKVDRLLGDPAQGQGLVGSLFSDEKMKFEFSMLSSNLLVLSSNLNKYGLLYKPKPEKKGFFRFNKRGKRDISGQSNLK